MRTAVLNLVVLDSTFRSKFSTRSAAVVQLYSCTVALIDSASRFSAREVRCRRPKMVQQSSRIRTTYYSSTPDNSNNKVIIVSMRITIKGITVSCIMYIQGRSLTLDRFLIPTKNEYKDSLLTEFSSKLG